VCRERKKQKYSNLQGTVEELSEQLHQLALMREAHAAVSAERDQLAVVADQQRSQLAHQAGLITAQQQQMGAQAAQLDAANQQLAEAQQQVGALSQQVAELRTRTAPTADELSEQLALAVKAALAASTLGAGNNGSPGAAGGAAGEREEARVRQVVCGLPERVLQQFMASCREVVRHLHQPEPAEGLQAIQVPCC
jgi:septal ring factor EnvC (AmiA/AmiB activator)